MRPPAPPPGAPPPTAGTDIVLATLNASYIHCAFGLRYLHANLGELSSRAVLLEPTINERPVDIVERILAHRPKIVGLGVYVWNARPTRDLVSLLKRVSPDTWIVLGGPEVSYETSTQEIVDLADFTITGEGDRAFPELCRALLADTPPTPTVIRGAADDLTTLQLPYRHYTDHDIRHRVVYVEASRGCPYRCEFCLSALDTGTRYFPLTNLLKELDALHRRGARIFKFVDRTFNLRMDVAEEILTFFLDRMAPDLFVHLEVVPDRLPEPLFELLRRFPPGSLQLEIGIQTLNPEVADRISRPLKVERVLGNLDRLRRETGAHLHADLIMGLPGETEESFATGFNRLVQANPHEIQVGVLKRLRGTPIIRHETEFSLAFEDIPPYGIMRTSTLSFEQLRRMGRFAQLWNTVVNSGNFRDTAPLIWRSETPYQGFDRFARWLHGREGKVHGVSLDRMCRYLLDYLVEERGEPHGPTREGLLTDYERPGRIKIPNFLRDPMVKRGRSKTSASGTGASSRLARQRRHGPETATGSGGKSAGKNDPPGP